MKNALVVSAVLLLTVAGLPRADAQTAADKDAIHDLMWRYALAFEALDPDAYVALFAEDGQFGPTQGRDALRESIENLKASRLESPQEYLLITDARIEFIDATHAHHHHYWMTVFEAAEQGGRPNVTAVGRGVDELVKVNGRWLIQTRLATEE